MGVINLATQSYVEWLIAEREDRYTQIRQYRDYADGDHTDYLTDEQRILLVGETSSGSGTPNTAPEVVLNVCGTILDVEADRLEVRGFTVNIEDNPDESDRIAALVWDRWKASRMDEGQQNVHYCAARDEDAYTITYWDEDAGESRIAFNRQYDGESSGVDMFYQDDDTNNPIFAVKIWTLQRPVIGNAKANRILRKNVYYEDRVEKYINTNAGTGETFIDANWRPLEIGDPDWTDNVQSVMLEDPFGNMYPATVEWWTVGNVDGGEPLGLPVAHFRHQSRGEAHGKSTLAPIVPGLQDEINLKNIALLAATILNGFKIIYLTNFQPNETETISAYPGVIIYNERDGGGMQFGETNLIQMRDMVDSSIKNAATLTGTPLNFFNLTGQIPAEGTQRQLELGLLAKTRRNQTSYGNSYEDAIRLLLKLEAVYGSDLGHSLEEIDTWDISCEWEPATVRNDLEEAQIAQIWDGLKVPQDRVWGKLGFSADEIAEMEEARDVARAEVLGTLSTRIMQMEAEQEAAENGETDQPADRSNGSGGVNVGTDAE